jgi:phosphatidylglycerol lysyltransferase
MSIDVPQRAQLRRKLRKAHAGGVQVSHLSLDQTVPLWPQLARVAAEWARRHGRERGFSMGQFSRATLSNQRIYVALQSGQLVGFVTFDIHPDHWSLDLIRYGQNVPDGTMHLLIMTAIQDAAARQIPRLSLAAVPEACCADTAYPIATRLLCGLGVIKPGLLQFKSSFAPDWEPLHLLGRNWLDIAVAMASISRAVFVCPNKSREIEHHVADFEFASADQSWHRR